MLRAVETVDIMTAHTERASTCHFLEPGGAVRSAQDPSRLPDEAPALDESGCALNPVALPGASGGRAGAFFGR